MREVNAEETLKIDKSGCFQEAERQEALVQRSAVCFWFVLFCVFYFCFLSFYAIFAYKPFSTLGAFKNLCIFIIHNLIKIFIIHIMMIYYTY